MAMSSGIRFRVEPRDVPRKIAARRLGMSVEEFGRVLPMIARGFPAPESGAGFRGQY
jgi:hypothetical protein